MRDPVGNQFKKTKDNAPTCYLSIFSYFQTSYFFQNKLSLFYQLWQPKILYRCIKNTKNQTKKKKTHSFCTQWRMGRSTSEAESRGVISKICVSGTRFVCPLSNPDLCVSVDVKNSLECIISVNQSKNSREKKNNKPQTEAPTSDRTVHIAEEQRNSSIP